MLGDRPIEITLQRAWDALSWRQRIQLGAELTDGLMSEQQVRAGPPLPCRPASVLVDGVQGVPAAGSQAAMPADFLQKACLLACFAVQFFNPATCSMPVALCRACLPQPLPPPTLLPFSSASGVAG